MHNGNMPASVGEKLEGAKLGISHIKIMLIAGSSFFTDAYDLFVIGVVLLILKPIFSLSAVQLGLLASAALFGAVIGPTLFGIIGDRYGRRYAYWTTVSILIIGAIGSSLSSSYIILLIWRFILGLGIGGDYPLSSTIVAEYANKDDRGKLIASTFAMQGFGIVAGIGAAFTLLAMGIPNAVVWRLLLGFGAIPGIAILYARTKIKETPLYSMSKGNIAAAMQAVDEVIYGKSSSVGQQLNAVQSGISTGLFIKKRFNIIFATALAWFLMDISYYGTGIFTPYIASTLGFAGIFAPVKVSAIVLFLFAVPGYWVAVALIDRQGRKSMQAIGFLAMGVLFIAIALFGQMLLKISVAAFLLLYGLTFFFTNYGPNTTTYVYPVELYPTQFRATGHGIASTAGKFGAALSALFFPTLLESMGKYTLIGMLGAIALLGCVITVVMLPETKRKSLMETSKEAELMLVTSTLAADFSSLLKNIDAASAMLDKMLAADVIENTKKNFMLIKQKEHDADTDVHRIMDYITNIRVNAVAYMDISHLAKRLDDIIDTMEAIAARISIYDIKKPDESMRKLSRTILKCISLVGESISELNKLELSKDSSRIVALYKEASRYENEADDLLRDALGRIMKETDVKKIIKYKEIYESMENVTDRCIDALDIVSDIALRYEYSK